MREIQHLCVLAILLCLQTYSDVFSSGSIVILLIPKSIETYWKSVRSSFAVLFNILEPVII
jgi:hypothetical protein